MVGAGVLFKKDLFVEDGEAGVYDAEVEVDEGRAEGVDELLDGVEVGYSLGLRGGLAVAVDEENC